MGLFAAWPNTWSLLLWTLVYLTLNLLGFLKWGNDTFKGYTKRSFAVGVVHEGVLLPLVFLAALKSSEQEDWTAYVEGPLGTLETHLHLMLLGYLLADLSNYHASPGFGSSLLVHHVLTAVIAGMGLSTSPTSGGGYKALCIVVPELGSLWLNIADIWPSRVVYWLRFLMYTGTRVVSAKMAYRMIALLQSTWWVQVSMSLLTVAFLSQNSTVVFAMGKSLYRKEIGPWLWGTPVAGAREGAAAKAKAS